MSVVKVDYTSYAESVKRALDAIGASGILSEQTAILIKPNLMGVEPPPVTTPVACCDAVLEYIRACSDAKVVVAEGCRDPHRKTHEVFIELGYADWAAEKGLRLVDLNDAPLEWHENADCEVFSQLSLPEIAFTHYIISVPVLKAHPLAIMTGTLKNMMGFAPPNCYRGKNLACWKKEVCFENLQQAIADLNRYRTPDLTVMDASIGLCESHLGGPWCDPPIGKILASFDPLALDRVAAGLLSLNWTQIAYLNEEIEEYSCY